MCGNGGGLLECEFLRIHRTPYYNNKKRSNNKLESKMGFK